MFLILRIGIYLLALSSCAPMLPGNNISIQQSSIDGQSALSSGLVAKPSPATCKEQVLSANKAQIVSANNAFVSLSFIQPRSLYESPETESTLLNPTPFVSIGLDPTSSPETAYSTNSPDSYNSNPIDEDLEENKEEAYNTAITREKALAGNSTTLQKGASCSRDTDCELVSSNCCGCNSGGKMTAVLKSKKSAYESCLKQQCSSFGGACSAQYKCEDYTAQCVNSQCIATKKQAKL